MPMLSEGCLEETQKFYEDFFGIRYDISKRFNFDFLGSFPFMNPLLILRPAGTTATGVISRLKRLGLKVEINNKLVEYFPRERLIPILLAVNQSDRPTKNTIGKSPEQISEMSLDLLDLSDGRSFLSLLDYLIATSLVFATTGKFLEEKFSTYFPETISPCGNMGRSDIRPLEHRLILTSGNSPVGCGARLVINVPLKF